MSCIQVKNKIQNQFTYNEKDLRYIVSGQVALYEIKDDILIAHDKAVMFPVSLLNKD